MVAGYRLPVSGLVATPADVTTGNRQLATYEHERRVSRNAFSMSARACACDDGTASMACWNTRTASSHEPFAVSTRASVSRTRYESGPVWATALRANDSASSSLFC